MSPSLADTFRNYQEFTFPDATPDTIEDLRAAFYAGVGILLVALHDIERADKGTSQREKRIALVHGFLEELEAYAVQSEAQEEGN